MFGHDPVSPGRQHQDPPERAAVAAQTEPVRHAPFEQHLPPLTGQGVERVGDNNKVRTLVPS